MAVRMGIPPFLQAAGTEEEVMRKSSRRKLIQRIALRI
jgi:hypothetical protein